jgi:hypothetical protein
MYCLTISRQSRSGQERKGEATHLGSKHDHHSRPIEKYRVDGEDKKEDVGDPEDGKKADHTSVLSASDLSCLFHLCRRWSVSSQRVL